MRTLIDPAAWRVGSTGYADLDAAGIRQIHDMRRDVMVALPIRIASPALVRLTQFRPHHAGRIRRVIPKVGIAVALSVDLRNLFAAYATMNITGEGHVDALANQRINIKVLTKTVGNRNPGGDPHFFEIALPEWAHGITPPAAARELSSISTFARTDRFCSPWVRAGGATASAMATWALR